MHRSENCTFGSEAVVGSLAKSASMAVTVNTKMNPITLDITPRKG